MEDFGTIAGIAGSALLAIGVLAKAILKLVENQKKRSLPPPRLVAPVSDDTGRFQLATALEDEALSDRFDRMERAQAMVLKNSAGQAQTDAAIAQIVETIDKLGLVAEVGERRAIERDRAVMERLRLLEEGQADRDVRVVRETLKQLGRVDEGE